MGLPFEKLESEIIIKNDYILVNLPDAVTYWDIVTTLGRLFSMPEFPKKNLIWQFAENTINFSISDLNRIKEFSAKHHPADSDGYKTAIVANTGLQRAVAEMYAAFGKELPRIIKVFSDLKLAEEWLSGTAPKP